MYYDDDEGNAGCFGGIIELAIIAMLFGVLKVIGIIALVLGGIALLVWALSKAESASEQRAVEAKEREERLRAEREAEAARLERERLEQELRTFEEYFQSQQDPAVAKQLQAANAILRKLNEDEDEVRRAKVLAFYDKYLPLVTESIRTAERGGTQGTVNADLEATLATFTDAVKAFSRDLYNVDEIVDINKKLLEQLAIQDGLLDPLGDSLRASAPSRTEPPE